MKNLLQLVIFSIIIITAFHKCANPGRPTGGPKDTIPPKLISALPVTGTTNFNGDVIELEFSELIKADKLNQELIITPKSDIRYKSIVKRNKLIIRLEDDLQDSTTYNFNFANGVTDITEKTPAVNLSIAFSTGPFIDSMSVQGSVEKLLNQEPGKGYVVSLYLFTDSLDYFTDDPMYFTTANDSGLYKMNYIKKGNYKIIAFNDDNNNFLLDPETEAHGFLSDTIRLDSATSLPTMRSVLQNVKPLTLINTRSTGRYVEIKFNKQVDNYSLSPDYLNHNIIGEKNDVIRIYKSEQVNYGDSILSTIIANDSLGNSINDTIKYVFYESNRKPSGFSYSTPSSIEIIDNPQLSVTFNKPIILSDAEKITIEADSIFSMNPDKSIEWNYNHTRAKILLHINKDSLLQAFENSIPLDTTINDSSIQSKPTLNQRQLEIKFNDGTFISAENDTSEVKSVIIKKPKEAPKGTLKLKLLTERESFILQLIDSSGKVKYQRKNQKDVTFASIKPGTYRVRILIDNNGDGKWSYGNLLKNQQPEEVFLFDQDLSIRENWVIEDVNITF